MQPKAGADATPTPPPQAAAPTQPQAPTGAPDSPTVHRSAESIVARKPVRPEANAIPIPTPTPQAAAPTQPQTPTGAPDSPTVHKSAESIVAREPVRPASTAASRAATRAAVKAALKGRAGDDEDDVQLKPEEMGFAGRSDDAFAGLCKRLSMRSMQGRFGIGSKFEFLLRMPLMSMFLLSSKLLSIRPRFAPRLGFGHCKGCCNWSSYRFFFCMKVFFQSPALTLGCMQH